jgi:hypothetical protein
MVAKKISVCIKSFYSVLQSINEADTEILLRKLLILINKALCGRDN